MNLCRLLVVLMVLVAPHSCMGRRLGELSNTSIAASSEDEGSSDSNLVNIASSSATTGGELIAIGNNTVTAKIVGGSIVTNSDFGFAVSLHLSNGQVMCGGSLIHRDYVLTATHCYYGSLSVAYVQVGVYNLKKNSNLRIRYVETAYKHSGYSTATNDVTILKLKALSSESAYSSYPDAISLYSETGGSLEDPYTTATVMGWGFLAPASRYQDELRSVNVPLSTDEQCATAYPKYFTTNNICAGDYTNGGKDSCTGDSGGPLVVADSTASSGYRQVGIVSYGYSCALAGYPGLYMRVSSYYEWIRSILAAGGVSLPAGKGTTLSPDDGDSDDNDDSEDDDTSMENALGLVDLGDKKTKCRSANVIQKYSGISDPLACAEKCEATDSCDTFVIKTKGSGRCDLYSESTCQERSAGSIWSLYSISDVDEFKSTLASMTSFAEVDDVSCESAYMVEKATGATASSCQTSCLKQDYCAVAVLSGSICSMYHSCNFGASTGVSAYIREASR